MTAYLSKKIKILSAISILMVLYIHMYYTEGNNMPILHIIEGTMGQYCLIAVPLFYLISGYLFFLKMPEGIHSIPGKLRKKSPDAFNPLYNCEYTHFCILCCPQHINLGSAIIG